MKKLVNIQAITPVTGVPQIVRGTLKGVTMSVEDIFKCLCSRATVHEIIGDKLIRLDFDNYNKNNAEAVKPAVVPTAPPKPKPEKTVIKATSPTFNPPPESKPEHVTPPVETPEPDIIIQEIEPVVTEDATIEEPATVEEITTEDNAEEITGDEPTEDEAVDEPETTESIQPAHQNNNANVNRNKKKRH